MQIKDSYLTFDGFHIPKNELNQTQINEITQELTVVPKGFGMGINVTQENIQYKVFVDNPTTNEYIVPRYYAIEKFGLPEKILFKHETCLMQFTGNLRDYQKSIIQKCLEHLKSNGGGLLSVPCGRGKTVMAIKLACELGVKTLVVVHKTFLQDQWIDRIKAFSNASVGIIRQNLIETENKDIVVGMIQSISKRNYDSNVFEQFGLVIYDEAHHCPSKCFSKALAKTGTKYTLALSATPYRQDGLIKIMHWFIGKTIYQEKLQSNNQVVVKLINFHSTNNLFVEKKIFFQGESRPHCPKMINNLVKLECRNNHIINIIDQIRKDPDRKILILSGRKKQLELLKTIIDNHITDDITNGKILNNETKTYFYTGDVKQEDRIKAEQDGDILFATYDMAHEGLDIERLNTVILATPKKDIVQSIGRILRRQLIDGDIRPLIIDFSDCLSVFINQSKIRQRFYRGSKYDMNQYFVVNDNFVNVIDYENIFGSKNTNCSKPENLEELLNVLPVEFKFEDDKINNKINNKNIEPIKNDIEKKPKKNVVNNTQPKLLNVFGKIKNEK